MNPDMLIAYLIGAVFTFFIAFAAFADRPLGGALLRSAITAAVWPLELVAQFLRGLRRFVRVLSVVGRDLDRGLR